jgi:hypothetical protein
MILLILSFLYLYMYINNDNILFNFDILMEHLFYFAVALFMVIDNNVNSNNFLV